jgi:hypothetical protein
LSEQNNCKNWETSNIKGTKEKLQPYAMNDLIYDRNLRSILQCEGVTQVVELLPGKHEALSSNSGTVKNNVKENKYIHT